MYLITEELLFIAGHKPLFTGIFHQMNIKALQYNIQ